MPNLVFNRSYALEFSKRWEDKKVGNMNILLSFLSTKIFGKARYR
jgi:hypothetical protein